MNRLTLCYAIFFLVMPSVVAAAGTRCPGHLASSETGEICFCPDGSVGIGDRSSGLDYFCPEPSRFSLSEYPGAQTSLTGRAQEPIATFLDGLFSSRNGLSLITLFGLVAVVTLVAWHFDDSPARSRVGTDLMLPSQPNLLPLDGNKIHLKLKRSQRLSIFGRPVFILDARADVSAEAQRLISKYRLGRLVVFDSKRRTRSAEAAYAHFSEASQPGSVARSLWKNARGLASASLMALALRITVDRLISGQHIECKDLEELLGAESAIIEACKSLRGYLDTALTFDGREELLEF